MRQLGIVSQATPTTESVTLRLSREVVERFCTTGNGWQLRVDEALKGMTQITFALAANNSQGFCCIEVG